MVTSRDARGRISRFLHSAFLAGALLVAAPAAHASPPPWQRTETREPCASFNTFRNPYFGDTHVHTTYSFDAVSGDVSAGPREAYRFAEGEPLGLPGGGRERVVRLRRPLDFTVVTDHAEFFGEVQTCLTAGLPGYDSETCTSFREEIPQTDQENSPGIQLFATSYLVPTNPERFAFCGEGAVDCAAQASLVWQDTRDAAEEFYDRTAACAFTTFVGYEWTGNTNIANLHRNVIFRNEVVPALPVSYVDQPTAQGLWGQLKAQCLDGLAGCDVLAIPHNSNISHGLMFSPVNADGGAIDAEDALYRAAMEPLVEITQHKGDSECRPGVLTSDELCGFEKWNSIRIGLGSPPPRTPYPPLLFVRNALKEGLVQEEKLGANPFRLGLIGGTDTHNATSGLTNEEDYVGAGHLGTRDATPELMMHPNILTVTGGSETNAGGLGVLWAEENSRDALFAAMRRREVYGTSGTRPILRFFGGELSSLTCESEEFAATAYKGGVPMGGEIGPLNGDESPRFAVLALKDPGSAEEPGMPLQRIQIIKGWVDAGGNAEEKVFEVAGDPDNGATVDMRTCETFGAGFDSLCVVWEDPEFDRSQRAFYYARVLENPVCRWSTRLCNAEGVDCDDPATIRAGLEECCSSKIEKTIQERAWASPIWYRPEGVARLKAKISFGNPAGTDKLKLIARLGTVPPEFDLETRDLSVSITDDDDIYRVTIPAGTFEKQSATSFVFKDPGGSLAGITSAKFKIGSSGEGLLKLKAGAIDLATADRSDHMVTVELSIGTYRVAHTRLWESKGSTLAPAKG